MSVLIQQHRIDTSHGTIAVEERGEGEIPVLLIHGNSSCRGVFRRQLDSSLPQRHRFIAFDLPGHGESSDAPNPQRTYTLAGFADASVELLGNLDISEAIVFGWSLGGHIAIEMLSRFSGLRGLLLSGSPPIAKVNGVHNMMQGFNSSPNGSVAGREMLSESEIQSFIGSLFGDSAEPFLFKAAARADGRFRKRLFEAAREGAGTDQRQAVEKATLPIGVINGASDHLIKLDYFDTVNFRHLWDGVSYRLPGLGHVPFWQGPDAFNPLLDRFLNETESLEKNHSKAIPDDVL
ncbi:alpha/beta fold hydrolase [Granulicella sp. L60]|uniref:alpha/beta fold hydrolase n=1 Tax=Granulicella sp. L60 TaxID=1641866 RepID=UPI001C209AA2|nr:alpha/beta hydrolase [Granulicella sp. L60]